MGVLGGLTDAMYSQLMLAEQRQIWQAIQSGCAGSLSAEQAAALKALGALAACPSSQLYPGGNQLRSQACVDQVALTELESSSAYGISQSCPDLLHMQVSLP